MSGFFSSFKQRTRERDIRKIERICKETGKVEKLKKILTNCDDIDVNAVRFDGFTALQLCALNNFPSCIEYLLSIGADTQLDSDNDGSTAFHLACWGGSLQSVKLLLPSKDTLLERNQKGYTGLHFACAAGKEDIYRCLLDLGADSLAINREGYTPMLLAACNGQTDAVKFLIDNKYASVNDVNAIGASALHMACAGNYVSLTNYLLTVGANIYKKDNKGRYPIDFCKKSKSDCRKIINEYVRKKGPGIFNNSNNNTESNSDNNKSQNKNPVSILSYIGSATSFWSNEENNIDYFEEPVMKHQIDEDNSSTVDHRSDGSSINEGAWGVGDWMTEYSENPSDSKMNETDVIFLQYNEKHDNSIITALDRERENKKKLGYGLTVPAYKSLSSSLLKEIPVKKGNNLKTIAEQIPQKTSKTTEEDDDDDDYNINENGNRPPHMNTIASTTAAVASWITFGATDGLLAVSSDDQQPQSVVIAVASSGDTPRKVKNSDIIARNESFDLESLEGSVSSVGNVSSVVSEKSGSLISNSTISQGDITGKKSPYSSVKNAAHLR